MIGWALVGPVVAGTPEEAERQYRVARRLAADGSADARVALQKVIELDPGGPLVDDALVEQALLERLPRWPEELGAIDPASCARALELLDRAIDGQADGDRLPEARYYRALLHLEPLPTHDAARARIDLITVATDPRPSDWSHAARYAGGWLAAATGRRERAESAYGRLLVDAAGSLAATRAAVALARSRLRDGDPGGAALLLDRALREGVDERLEARALRELAVRLALGGAAALPGDARTVIASTGVRALSAAAPTARGVLVADARSGAVLEFGGDGRAIGSWSVPQASALAVDRSGRVFAANHESVLRLRAGGATSAVASVGEFASPAAMAVDPLGRVWLLDRRGDRVGKIEPGAALPEPYWTSKEHKLASLALDGTTLVAIDTRGRDVVTLDGTNGVERAGAPDLQRPLAVAVDAAGRVAVLDAKGPAVRLHASGGQPWVTIPCKPAGVERPTAVGFAADGALQLFDESTGGWVRLR